MIDTTKRDAALRQMLNDRRREMQDDVRGRVQQGRTDRRPEACDVIDVSNADIQDDIDFALLQMRAETLAQIEEALVRLDAGKYGACIECGSGIAEPRLRALPFAVRCQACEERREEEQERARRLAGRGAGFSLFSNAGLD